MRAVVQRVSEASVTVDGTVVGAIAHGLLVLLGVEDGDTDKDAQYIIDKMIGLRIFDDENGQMNLDLQQVGGKTLIVSQFTLLGDVRKGRRPGFTAAAKPEIAKSMYEQVCDEIVRKGIGVERGIFQADMKVRLLNDGPVTILLDSRKTF